MTDDVYREVSSCKAYKAMTEQELMAWFTYYQRRLRAVKARSVAADRIHQELHEIESCLLKRRAA